MRTTLVFVNKVDRGGARQDAVLYDIAEKLTPSIVPMNHIRGIGASDARVLSYGEEIGRAHV